jgi:hypothetical protein
VGHQITYWLYPMGIFVHNENKFPVKIIVWSPRNFSFWKGIATLGDMHTICIDCSKNLNIQKKMKNEKTIMIAIAVYAAAIVTIFNILGAQMHV